MIRPTLIDLNPVELNYYPFMVNLDKFSESCNSVDDLSTKICVLSKTKDINFNVFSLTANINEAKTIVNHVSCDCKYKFKSSTFNSNQNWSNDKCECKTYCTCKRDYSWNPSTCFCESSKHLKHIVDDLVIACDEIKCYIYCINKYDKYYSNKCNKYCFNKLS